jgi:hypothetical protein
MKTSKKTETKALNKALVRRSAILNLSEENRLKRADKLWKKLVKELHVLQNDNYTARKLFDYVERHYA